MVFSRFWRAMPAATARAAALVWAWPWWRRSSTATAGWVQVEGEKGKGACFTIHIPLYDEDASKHRRNSKKRTGHKKPAKASR